MNKAVQHSFVVLFSLGLALGVLFGLSQVSAQPAQADATCSGTSICISIHKGWVGSNSSSGGGLGSGSGAGNSGTVSKPTPIPCVSKGTTYFVKEGNAMPHISTGWRTTSNCVPRYKVHSVYIPFNGAKGWCAVTKKNGVDIKAVGYIKNMIDEVKFVHKTTIEGDLIKGVFYYGYSSKPDADSCIYPKVSSVVNNKYCALNTTVTFDRLNNSRAGAKRIKSTKKTIATIGQLQGGSGTCIQSANVSFSSNIPNNPNNWGQYKLAGSIAFARCTQVKTTFDGKVTTNYGKCVSDSTPAVVAHATLWCGGASSGLLNKTWTMNDCYNRPTGGYTCTVPKPTFDGKTGLVQTLRDGKGRILNWGKPKIGKSIKSTFGWEQTVAINGGSSPRKTAVSDNSKSAQSFWSSSTFGKSWNARKDSQQLGFYEASNPGGSFQATRNMRFDGQFETKVGDITSYNPWTGKMGTKTRTVLVNDYNIKCATATSPKVQVIRTIGDVQ